MPLSRVTPLLAIALAACASSGAPAAATRAYVAPTDRTVYSQTEEAHGPRPEQVIFVSNHSSVPVTVYSVTLRDCENIQQPCDSPTKLNVKLAPGQRGFIRRVSPKNTEGAFSYRYSFAWRTDSSTEAATLTALAGAGETGAAERLASMRSAEADRAATVGGRDEDLGAAELARLATSAASLRLEPEALVMKPGDVVSLHRIHVVLLDAQGARLGRVRQYQWRLQDGPVIFSRPDSLIALRTGSTVAEFSVPQTLLPGRATPLAAATLRIAVQD